MEATTVRVLKSTNKAIDEFCDKANKERKKKGMFKLTKMQVIDIAIKKLEHEDGIK